MSSDVGGSTGLAEGGDNEGDEYAYAAHAEMHIALLAEQQPPPEQLFE